MNTDCLLNRMITDGHVMKSKHWQSVMVDYYCLLIFDGCDFATMVFKGYNRILEL